jgi:hypothetical protein
MDPGVEETLDPMDGMYSDSRRLLRKLMGYGAVGKRLEVQSKGRNGFIWTKECNLPDFVVKACK